eukprot:g26084.t1
MGYGDARGESSYGFNSRGGKDRQGDSRDEQNDASPNSQGGAVNGMHSKGSGQVERRNPAKFVPARGGGEWGKRMRQAQQAAIKDEKTRREVDYFWQQQEYFSSGGKGRKGKGFQEPGRKRTGWFLGTIHFDKYDDIPVDLSGDGAEKITALESFDELWDRYYIHEFLWDNLERCHYSRPTPIQRFAIPVALAGSDAMCCAQTGSGKTCAFLLPIISSLDTTQAYSVIGSTPGEMSAPRAVVLAPTRELCSQIHLEAKKLSFQSPIRAGEVYGGRLTDFIDRGVITMANVGFLVLDEADRMLDMGFEPQIREIVQKRDMPSSREGRMTLMFSATFPKEIQKLAQAFMRNYIWIGVGRVGGAVDTVEQSFIVVPERGKFEALTKVLNTNPTDSTLIFVAMKRTAAWLEDRLMGLGYNSVAIHEREASLSTFKSGKSTFLVATDVAARGLDIPKVSHVINYDLPHNIDSYVHRIGRTGRIGNHGWATSFYVPGSDAQHSNANVVKDLVGILEGAGQPVPQDGVRDVAWKEMERPCPQAPQDLKDEAFRQGYKQERKPGKGGGGWGGRDSRGGNNIRSQAAWSKGSKGKGGGGGKSKGKTGGGGGKSKGKSKCKP